MFAIAACLLINSCRAKQEYVTLVIDNQRIDSVHDISSMIESIKFTELKEVDGEHFGSIFNVHRLKNYFLVYDRLNVNKIFLFDEAGKFIKTIVKTGFGKQDAANINSFWINNNGKLEVYDYGECKIFQYDSNFNLVRIKKAAQPIFFASIQPIPHSGNYIGYANYNLPNLPVDGKSYRIAFMDSNMNIIKTNWTFDKKFSGIPYLTYPQHFIKYHDTIRFVEAYNNYIHTISGSMINRSYKISYSASNLPDDIVPSLTKNLALLRNPKINPMEKLRDLKKYSRFAGTWLENNKYIYLASRDSTSEPFISLVDKLTNTVLFNARNFSETDKYKLSLPPFQFYDEENDEYIGVSSGTDLHTRFSSDSKFAADIIASPVVNYLIRIKLK